ncbi:MAG: PDZ domain-containing protein [Planctomycetia bacterium]|nr:PDZ domain-containing protein [Planctomycetia bacterium]
MVVETQVPPFLSWLLSDSGDGQSALTTFLFTALVLFGLATMVAFLVAAFRYGPGRAFSSIVRGLGGGIVDFVRMSPRRILALSWLAFREAFRRQIWVGLVVFLVILMFAGWFLDPSSDDPARLYLGNVLNWTTLLMLVMALYLSSLSLPADIKNRTIYTIVTKPVRSSEIILGRIVGFTAACTVLLVIMAGASYVFVSRALAHRHVVVVDDIVPVKQNRQVVRYDGKTKLPYGHQHHFTVPANSFAPGIELSEDAAGHLTVQQVTAAARAADVKPGDILTAINGATVIGLDTAEEQLAGAPGSNIQLTLSRGGASHEAKVTREATEVFTDIEKGHRHRVVVRWVDGKLQADIGPAEGMLVARVPIYGLLRFRDRQGDPKDPSTWKIRQKGISVGKLFGYRSYIEGNTLAAAVWTFDDLKADQYPQGLPLDASIRVYRGQRGRVDQGITGSLTVVNPAKPTIRSREIIFTAKEFTLDRIQIPQQLTDSHGKPLALFGDASQPNLPSLVTPDGRVEVWVRCVEPAQYFGMARADLYVRGADASYTMNFVKAFFEIWLQIVLVTSLAVLFSSFLSGPVAVLLTVTTILMGFSCSFIANLANSVIYREELKVIELVRQGAAQRGLYLTPDQTFAKAHDLRKDNVDGFRVYDEARLKTALRLELDQVDVLDRVWGGGPLEAFYRLITQRNLMIDLEMNWAIRTMQFLDKGLMHVMQYLLHVLPDFRRFSDTDYLANGYNIQGARVGQHAAVTLAFALAAFIGGYFIFRHREMAA